VRTTQLIEGADNPFMWQLHPLRLPPPHPHTVYLLNFCVMNQTREVDARGGWTKKGLKKFTYNIWDSTPLRNINFCALDSVVNLEENLFVYNISAHPVRTAALNEQVAVMETGSQCALSLPVNSFVPPTPPPPPPPPPYTHKTFFFSFFFF